MLEEDIEPSFHLAVSDIHDHEIRKLRKRKYVMHVVFSLLALTIILSYAFYYTKACRKVEYYAMTEDKDGQPTL